MINHEQSESGENCTALLSLLKKQWPLQWPLQSVRETDELLTFQNKTRAGQLAGQRYVCF